MATARRKASKSNRMGMIVIAGIVLVLLIGLLVQSQKLRAQNAEYTAKVEELNQQIRDEELRAEEISELKDYVYSLEYIESVARDQLGLVYSDEIIFKAEE